MKGFGYGVGWLGWAFHASLTVVIVIIVSVGGPDLGFFTPEYLAINPGITR